ncbi:hypothetical protein O181_021100 [Austropuccinia psidii MF-1]|uniref:Uncharacterized protein n=1 Tax=Austropuccinia psidii MF-1 TaxID=1389203 RepID=A0A9Q3CDZ2_9BASI|nr:hypothetical protein [Austropuccinia psidii MF-1]
MDGIHYHPKYRSKDKGMAQQKEVPEASTRKPQANQHPQEGRKNKKKNWKKPYSPSCRIPRIQKDALENFSNMARNLMELKDKEEQRMRQPSLPKR